MNIKVYTDGSATTMDKPGGWAYVIIIDDRLHSENSGHVEKATNNDMELLAAINGLKAVLDVTISSLSSFPQENEVTLISDSQLILGWANGTYTFRQKEKMFLYEELRRLMRKLNAKTEWIKGHSGQVFNERCDELANQARLGLQMEKKKEEVKTTGESLIGDKKDAIYCLWYNGNLKIIDLDNLVIENYNRKVHGKRGSSVEIRKGKLR